MTLYLGTSSWTFPDWWGVFYPGDLPKDRALSHYAIRFASVEVNTSFYGLPAPRTVIQWVETVPEGFTFALKAPRQISHERRLVDCHQETLAYLDLLRSLGPAAGPGLLQLPPSLNRRQDGRRLATYLDWLAPRLDGIHLAVEVRSADLMTPSFAGFLAQRGVGLVVADRAGTPDLFDIWAAVMDQPGAPQFVYVRLIGDDRTPLPDDREIRRPQDEALDRWAERIAGLLAAGRSAYVYVHNPYEGHSPATVRRLRARVHRLYPLPEWSPTELSGDNPSTDDLSGQLELF
jgi:uncharacterized protein YecE (DUF72 family)